MYLTFGHIRKVASIYLASKFSEEFKTVPTEWIPEASLYCEGHQSDQGRLCILKLQILLSWLEFQLLLVSLVPQAQALVRSEPFQKRWVSQGIYQLLCRSYISLQVLYQGLPTLHGANRLSLKSVNK